MTESYLPQSTPPPEQGTPQSLLADEDPGTAEVIKDQAADLGHGGVEAGRHTAVAAREQASNVTSEASRQGKDLIRQAQGQLMEQAGQQPGASSQRQEGPRPSAREGFHFLKKLARLAVI